MKLVELEHAVDFTLPSPSILYRVQRLRSRRGAVAIGPLRVPPRGLLLNRFDLVDDEAAYFAESSETAVYETMARREATSLSMTTVASRALLTLQTTAPLRLLDLRFHAGAWPVLQSLRYAETQELAREARALGYDGFIYRGRPSSTGRTASCSLAPTRCAASGSSPSCRWSARPAPCTARRPRPSAARRFRSPPEPSSPQVYVTFVPATVRNPDDCSAAMTSDRTSGGRPPGNMPPMVESSVFSVAGRPVARLDKESRTKATFAGSDFELAALT